MRKAVEFKGEPTCDNCGGLHYGSPRGRCIFICTLCGKDIRIDAADRCLCPQEKKVDALAAQVTVEVKAEMKARDRVKNNRIAVGSDLHLMEMLLQEIDQLRLVIKEQESGKCMPLILSPLDERLMMDILQKTYSADCPHAFRVSAEHYRYIAEQVTALRVHIKRNDSKDGSPTR